MNVISLPPELDESFGSIRQAKSNSEVRGSQLKPINVRLQEMKDRFSKPAFKPRHYQVELYQQTLKGNTIIYLGTGLGKTFIVVMLLKSPQISDQIRCGRRAVFLAPTQDLVKQQAEFIYTQVPYKVKVYCGRTCNTGLHIDNWDKEIWDKEFETYEVLFMTPAILHQALAINAISWTSICVLIFDEVHHAATSNKERTGKKLGSHYSQILRHHRVMFQNFREEPKFVGLTASLINNMPKDAESIRLGVKDIEEKLAADCVTDLSAIESKPRHVIWNFFQQEVSENNDILYNLFLNYARRYEESLEVLKVKKMTTLGPKNDDDKRLLAYHNRLRLASSGFSIKPQSFHKVLKQLAAIRKSSGLWTLGFICFNLAKAMETHSGVTFLSKAIKPVYTEFGNILRKVTVAIHDLIGTSKKSLLIDYSEAKLVCLLNILLAEYNEKQNRGSNERFSCIVFVKSRVEVVAICKWLDMVSKHVEGYDFIKADYAVGLSATMSSKWACITRRKSIEQSSMLDSFRRGDLNVIVTTSVLEEGIDLPICSTIIRYDPAPTFRVYVQSRGRARQAQSSYVDMCEESKHSATKDALDKFNDFEERVKEVLKKKDKSQQPIRGTASIGSDYRGGDNDESKSQDFFKDEANGILIHSPIAKTILYMYCARLARTCPYSDGLQFTRQQVGELFQTTLYFPSGCPIKDDIRGKLKITPELADSSAVVAAFEALYKAGELDKHGVPVRATEEHIDRLLEKFNLKPDFSPLDGHLAGEIITKGGRDFYVYSWRLFNLTHSSLMSGFGSKRYKLLEVRFIAESDEVVRNETRCHFENVVFGMILEASSDHENLPENIWSHYGIFKVVYRVINSDYSLDSHSKHYNLSNYTFRLIMMFWNPSRLQKSSFFDRCLFYLVPLNSMSEIDWERVRKSFYLDPNRMRSGDVVKINQMHSTGENFSKRFIIDEIIHTMGPDSIIPGTRVTFYDRLREQGLRVQTARQPVIAVRPISRDFGKTHRGKQVRSEDTSQLVYYLGQCLERIECNPDEAFQAYNLPAIAYQIYLNALAADLELQFKRATAGMRSLNIMGHRGEKDNREPNVVDDKGANSAAVNVDHSNEPLSGAAESETPEFEVPEFDDVEFSDSDSCSSFDCESISSDSSDSDAPKPSERYRDILARQEFNRQDRDKYNLEVWNMAEYNVPDLRRQEARRESSYHSAKHASNSSILSLPQETLIHQQRVEEILTNFQQGFIGDADFTDENEIYNREGLVVDRSIKPPITFDRWSEPIRTSLTIPFLEAITLNRANNCTNLEAFENIGDSYLKYCVSVVLFNHIQHNEGMLTSARSRLVSNKHFCHLARKNRLGAYAVMNKFERDIIGGALGCRSTCKNQFRSKDLADMFEALIGACLATGGEYEAILAMKWLGLNHIFRDDTFVEFHKGTVIFSRHQAPPLNRDDPKSAETLKQSTRHLGLLQKILKYNFNDESYLLQAITHASSFHRCTPSYQRLEFLGDAILDFLVSLTLFKAGYTRDPGQLTTSRSALVSNYTFAKLALKFKFDVFIQHANHQLFDELSRVNEYSKADPDMKFLNIVDFDRISKTLADVFEAVAGAIYVDSGCSLDSVYSVYYPIMKNLIDEEIRNPTKNIIAIMYETFPGKDRIRFEYFKTAAIDNEDAVVCAKCVIQEMEFYGEGLNNRQAKMRAVQQVMENLPSPEEKSRLDEEWRKIEETRASQVGVRGAGGHRRGDHRRGGGNRGGGGRRGGPSRQHRDERREGQHGGHRGYRFRHKRF